MYPNEMDLVRAPDNFPVAGNFSLQQLPGTNKQPLQMQPSPSTMEHPLARPHMHSSPSTMVHPVSRPHMQQSTSTMVYPVSRPHMQPSTSTMVHPVSRPHMQPSTSTMVHPVSRPHMQRSINTMVHPVSRQHLQPSTKPRMQTLSRPMTQARFKPPSVTKQPPVAKPQPVIKQQASFKTRLQPPPKVRESFDNVRSKLRESLAEALALVDLAKSVQKDESESLEVSADASATKQDPAELPQLQAKNVAPYHKDDDVASPIPVELQSAQSAAVDVDCSNAMAVDTDSHNSLPEVSNRSSSNYIDLTQSDNEVPWMRNYIDEDKLEFAKMWSSDQEFNPSDIFPEEETFILKDDLLEANGLYWASDLDLEDFDMRDAKKPKLLEDLILPNVMSPQIMAAKIEEELFKLFGGVNKKYKEKGRSLLFNLKDRNNPELRERVMAGEIPPEKLCAMTAEELASKELSQWRIAKAEELAQMVVLPDSNVDLRRMVRKTHKGEIQVEFEQDDGASVEVAIGESSLTMLPSRTTVIEDETEGQVKIKTSEEAGSDTNKLVTDSLTSSDSVQGVMGEGELKSSELLPPIVSLDEFMESRNGGSPSDNSPSTVAEDMNSKDDSMEGTNLKVDLAGSNLKESIDLPSREEGGVEAERKIEKDNNNIKFDDNKIDLAVSVDESKGEKIWSGILQLAISSLITVVGIFRSGEKAATIEWPSLLEIKGRVRLDAFGKFLQELPQSRSRAVMVVQFFCEEGSPGSEQSKAIESYVADERPGFAEPAPGVELYVCSPGNNVSEMLSGLLPKENAEAVKNLVSGLIGIVVWRRAMFSTISPRPSHHRHQQNSRKNSSLKKQEKTNSMVQPKGGNTDAVSDDEDAPPGFGHVRAGGRDDDDLPDFQYVKPSNYTIRQSVAYGGGQNGRADRPVELVRSLIHKYGQNNTASSPMTWDHHHGRGVAGVETQPWNDEDDIPDWQPGREALPQSHPGQAPTAMHSYHDNTIYNQYSLQTPLIIPHQPQLVPLQPPLQIPYYSQPAPASDQTLVQPWQQQAWLTQPVPATLPPSTGAAVAQQQMMGQQYYGLAGHNKGMDWRH